jgi:hypothetical protein
MLHNFQIGNNWLRWKRILIVNFCFYSVDYRTKISTFVRNVNLKSVYLTVTHNPNISVLTSSMPLTGIRGVSGQGGG